LRCWGETYNGNNAVILQECVETTDELICEELNRFCTPSEDVVDDVVVLLGLGCVSAALDEGPRVFDDRGMVFGEVEVLQSILVDYRVDFDDGCVNPVAYQRARGCANSETAVKC
jgi:hypothetical protein